VDELALGQERKRTPSRGTMGLADAVQALREEIQDAMRSGASESVRFDLAPIELTLQAVVTKGADGKIGWKILEFGAKYESAVSPTWADQIPNTAESSTTNAEKSTTRENHGVGVGMGPNIKLR
jgi:hypothetical protein